MHSEIPKRASVYDMLRLPDFERNVTALRDELQNDPKFEELYEKYKEILERIFAENPDLRAAEIGSGFTFEQVVESTVRSLTLLKLEGERIHLDAPYLLKRQDNNPLYEEGIEDLEEKLELGDYKGMRTQLYKGINLIDGAAFSTSHNIHDGFIPLYFMRDVASTLASNAGVLSHELQTEA